MRARNCSVCAYVCVYVSVESVASDERKGGGIRWVGGRKGGRYNRRGHVMGEGGIVRRREKG